MARISDLCALYDGHLLPVLPKGNGVCPICHGLLSSGTGYCYQCKEAQSKLPATADVIGFIALAVKGEQLATDLWVYKSSRAHEARLRPQLGLSAVLWRWLSLHESCLAHASGVDGFPLVTTVPSAIHRHPHPLTTIVSSTVKITSDRYIELLKPSEPAYDAACSEHARNEYVMNERVMNERVMNSKRYVATRTPTGNPEPVLIIDDTFTSGAHIQSAAACLSDAGYGPIAALCIGRHFNRRPEKRGYIQFAESYYRAARQLGWSWDECSLCNTCTSAGTI